MSSLHGADIFFIPLSGVHTVPSGYGATAKPLRALRSVCCTRCIHRALLFSNPANTICDKAREKAARGREGRDDIETGKPPPHPNHKLSGRVNRPRPESRPSCHSTPSIALSILFGMHSAAPLKLVDRLRPTNANAWGRTPPPHTQLSLAHTAHVAHATRAHRKGRR